MTETRRPFVRGLGVAVLLLAAVTAEGATLGGCGSSGNSAAPPAHASPLP